MMRANPLGDIRAEADREMLDNAFVETPDYKTLIGTNDRPIVVGRRGSGKSALLYGLERYWGQVPRTHTVVWAPEEYQMIGLRPMIEQFGDKFSFLRAACRIVWRYALLVELACQASRTYRFPDSKDTILLKDHIRRWQQDGPYPRLRWFLHRQISKDDAPESRIANLPALLEVEQIEDALKNVTPTLKKKFVVLVDKLDEGFEPDTLGTALVDGLVIASIDINDRIPCCRTTVFVRDNICRAVAEADPNYSRNIEGQLIRLHWDESLLFNLTCVRLRRVFRIDAENNTKVWNRCTGSELHGMAGFRKALRLTLYRPRDILALLNQAFYRAMRHGQKQIALSDLNSTAQEISKTRLDDLHKEYKAIVPGLDILTSAFNNRDPELTGSDASEIVTRSIATSPKDQIAEQHFEIVGSRELVRSLYSIGFVGVKDSTSGAFAFCHDGRPPTRNIDGQEKLLVHPCYWMALDIQRPLLADTEAEEIHDEYEIHVDSQTPEIRKTRISQHIGELSDIQIGQPDWGRFEEWCLKTIRILFVGQLSNIELNPNKQATQRRDIVGTVTDSTGVWGRICEDYGTRQVLFEIKNQKGIGPDEYRQMLSYLTREYGKCGFIITRDDTQELTKGSKELHWTRESYDRHEKLIVRLSQKFLVTRLSKARSPRKHDDAGVQLGKIIDTYVRLYVSGNTASATTGRKSRKHSKR